MNKIRISKEVAYIGAITIQAFAVALVATADLGLSQAVTPSYLLSLKTFLSFGQAEYCIQIGLFIAMCIWVRKIQPMFFFSFLSLIFYGAILDLWRLIIPMLNPSVTPPGAESFSLPVRITCLLIGMVIIQFTIALSFKSYLAPLVIDFFVKVGAEKTKISVGKFKFRFDISCLIISLIMSFVFFGRIYAIGLGTFIQAATNGPVVNFFDKFLDKHCNFYTAFPKLENKLSKTV